MNVQTFKGLLMVADTPKAKQIRKYYLAMERIVNTYIKNQLNTSQKLIEEYQGREQKLIEEKTAVEAENKRIKKKYEEVDKTGYVYIIQFTLPDGSKSSYRVGKTDNVKNRKSSHQSSNEGKAGNKIF